MRLPENLIVGLPKRVISGHSIMNMNNGNFTVPPNTYIIPQAQCGRSTGKGLNRNFNTVYKNQASLQQFLRGYQGPMFTPGNRTKNVHIHFQNIPVEGTPTHIMGVLNLPLGKSVVLSNRQPTNASMNNNTPTKLSNVLRERGPGIYLGSYCRSIPGFHIRKNYIQVRGTKFPRELGKTARRVVKTILNSDSNKKTKNRAQFYLNAREENKKHSIGKPLSKKRIQKYARSFVIRKAVQNLSNSNLMKTAHNFGMQSRGVDRITLRESVIKKFLEINV